MTGRAGPGARYWCAWAWSGQGENPIESAVLVDVGADGLIADVTTGVPAPPGVPRLAGLTLPGMADVHSHAFHRALRGRTHGGTGSFWTWREQMYRVAARLTPDSYHRLARAVYAEMALAGITCVGEFHYLHHGPDRTRYDDPNAMALALVAAAGDAGIRITLLDTCYLAGGLGPDGRHLPLAGPQERFGDGDAHAWAERVSRLRPEGGHARVGAAVHSVRAVPRAQIPVVVEWARAADAPLHVHLSEQPAENEACRAATGLTPAGLLADTGALGPATTLVHATHLTDSDVGAIRASGTTVCLCPTTERDLADGLPRTADLVDGAGGDPGVRLTLGTDAHAQIDMFEEMRAVELHERLRTGRRGTLRAAELGRAAMASGHAALGWTRHGEPPAGVIRPGARADLVVLDLDGVRLAGTDPARAAEAAVFAATSADVRHVMADGRWIVRDGRHTMIPDAAELLDAAIKEVHA